MLYTYLPPSPSLSASLPPSLLPLRSLSYNARDLLEHLPPIRPHPQRESRLQFDLEMMESRHRLSRENHSPSTNLQKTVSARQSAMDDSWREGEGGRGGGGGGGGGGEEHGELINIPAHHFTSCFLVLNLYFPVTFCSPLHHQLLYINNTFCYFLYLSAPSALYPT